MMIIEKQVTWVKFFRCISSSITQDRGDFNKKDPEDPVVFGSPKMIKMGNGKSILPIGSVTYTYNLVETNL
jgi:hypothetical protein